MLIDSLQSFCRIGSIFSKAASNEITFPQSASDLVRVLVLGFFHIEKFIPRKRPWKRIHWGQMCMGQDQDQDQQPPALALALAVEVRPI